MIPYARQSIDDDDISAIVEVLRGDFLTTGPKVEAFEAALSSRLTSGQVVAVSSGTAALHLAALALDLGPGDAAVVPSLTFLATANSVRLTGAEIVFADVNPDTGLMSSEHLRDALCRVPDGLVVKAVLPVHLAGQTVELLSMGEIAAEFGCVLIEDACHAIGSRYRSEDTWRHVGSGQDSAMTCFSFHPVKTIAMGEGGAISTASVKLAERLRRLRNHSINRDPTAFTLTDEAFAADGTPHPWFYEMGEPGLNYRATDIHCALGLSQLKRLDAFVARRAELVSLYRQRFADLAPRLRPVPALPNQEPAWHLMTVHIDFAAVGKSRDQVMAELQSHGIGSQVHYFPVHRQPYYRRRYGVLDLPGANAYYASCLSLPLFPAMSNDDVERVVDTVRDVLGGN